MLPTPRHCCPPGRFLPGLGPISSPRRGSVPSTFREEWRGAEHRPAAPDGLLPSPGPQGRPAFWEPFVNEEKIIIQPALLAVRPRSAGAGPEPTGAQPPRTGPRLHRGVRAQELTPRRARPYRREEADGPHRLPAGAFRRDLLESMHPRTGLRTPSALASMCFRRNMLPVAAEHVCALIDL